MIRIGTRTSKLALIQTEIVKEKIHRAFPEETVEIVPIVTKGDKILDKPLASFGGKGVFTKEIEEALLQGTIDLAVHSAKDVPMEFPKGLALGAVLEREDPRDVLVTCSGIKAENMPAGSLIGTSSLRRELQIKKINKGIEVASIRGNVPTRLQKLRDGQFDGIILAAAGLKRLEMEKEEGLYYEYLEPEQFVPAGGQGILAVEIRQGTLTKVMEALNENEAEIALAAERRFLTALGGSCNAPCGVYVKKEGTEYICKAMYAKDGVHPEYYKERTQVQERDAVVRLGEQAAKQFLKDSAFVSLVGVGPGRYGTITLEAMERIKHADVIVYDYLIPHSCLNAARLDATLICVGKRANAHSMKQEEINQLLLEKAEEGGHIVRLKGGDPFVFGRGGEEALVLKEANIPYEILPGVSSSYSVPAMEGIPVTHRSLASSMHVITGHEGGHKKNTVVDYQVLAKEEGTLVFLMGLSSLPCISRKLMENGKSPYTKVAIISRGASARQHLVTGTLENIVEKAEKEKVQTPAIIVVGEVVGLAEKIGCKKQGILDGKRVLLIGTRNFAGKLQKVLEQQGAEAIAISLVETVSNIEKSSEQNIEKVKEYSWIVFTSQAGVKGFFEGLQSQHIDQRSLGQVKFAVVGKATKEALKQQGYHADFCPDPYTSKELAKQWIPNLSKEDKVLLVRGNKGSVYIEEALKKNEIFAETAVVYDTIVDKRRTEEIRRIYGDMDYVILSSGIAGSTLAEIVKEEQSSPVMVAIGPETKKACEGAGLTVDFVAKEASAEGILQVIKEDCKRK